MKARQYVTPETLTLSLKSGKHKYGISENASRRNSGDAYADGDHAL